MDEEVKGRKGEREKGRKGDVSTACAYVAGEKRVMRMIYF
jgi:hypothetical protein